MEPRSGTRQARGGQCQLGQGGVQRRVARIRECERAEGKPVAQADRRGRLRVGARRRGAADFWARDVRARLSEKSMWFSDADETSWECHHVDRRVDEPIFHHTEFGFFIGACWTAWSKYSCSLSRIKSAFCGSVTSASSASFVTSINETHQEYEQQERRSNRSRA